MECSSACEQQKVLESHGQNAWKTDEIAFNLTIKAIISAEGARVTLTQDLVAIVAQEENASDVL